MSSQNIGFNFAKIRALSGVYRNTYDDGDVLHCFIVLCFFFCVIVLTVLLCMYVCNMF